MRLRIDQDARVEHAAGIQFALGGPQRGGKKLWPLSVIPGSVISADGMVVRDGAARRDQRVARRVLDGLPLREQRTVATARVEGEVGRRPVRVDVGEATGDFTLHPGRLQNCAFGCRLDLIVKGFEPIPGDGGLERIVDDSNGRSRIRAHRACE